MGALAALVAAMLMAGGDEPPMLELDPGQRVPICGRLSACPLTTATCDDPNVARVVDGKAGPELEAGSVGSTLCGFTGPSFVRRVVKVKVAAGRR